jgi:dihydrofolate reductase
MVTTQSLQAISRIVQVSQSMIMAKTIEGSTDIRLRGPERYLLAMAKVRANLVVGSNGMTTKAGSSKPLSNRQDRAKFHELRQISEVILIGGSTFRNEPYSNCPLPLYISSHSQNFGGENIHSFNLSPVRVLERAVGDGFENILVEGGVAFLSELITEKLIDEFHITRSDKSGDRDELDENSLHANYKLATESKSGETKFEIWVPLNQQR